MRPRAVLLDIEGTVAPIAFVHDVLFPCARARLPGFLAAHAGEPPVEAALAETAALAPGPDPLATLLGWMDQDAKLAPLKTLQGMVWREAYEAGALRSELYPDVPPALRAWHAAGLTLAIYSSGSVEAQRLLFAHSDAGDLTPLLAGYFDTRTGAKREAASYAAIASGLAIPAPSMLFLSDIEAELDAAAAAGLATCQLVRDRDGTLASSRHRTARTLDAVPIG